MTKSVGARDAARQWRVRAQVQETGFERTDHVIMQSTVSRPGRAFFCLAALVTALVLESPFAAMAQANRLGVPMEVTVGDLNQKPRNNWLSYHGDVSGRRYSELSKISRDNVWQLELKWVFHSRKVRVLGAAPLVVGGVMYLAASNDLFAIDAMSGAVIWHQSRQDAPGGPEDESSHIDRGVAVLSNRVYMETDDGHLLSLDGRSGNVLWDVPFAEGYAGYGGVSAPLAIDGEVIVGAAGSKELQGGFVAAFDAFSGEERWKYTLPRSSSREESHALRDESWMPGTYDPELGLLYAATGTQPCNSPEAALPEELPYGGCLLALDAKSGRLKWQYPLPGLEHQIPAISTVPVLIDGPEKGGNTHQGLTRRWVAVAQASGYITVLDRATGKLVSQRDLSVALKTAGDGDASSEGTAANSRGRAEKGCSAGVLLPSWNPAAYSQQTQLFYFTGFEEYRQNCLVSGRPGVTKGGNSKSAFLGTRTMLAYDLVGGVEVWRGRPVDSSYVPAGATVTASSLLLYGGSAQSFDIADAGTGRLLWSFPLGQSPTIPPITYAIGDRQYFAIAAGNDLFVFGLP